MSQITLKNNVRDIRGPAEVDQIVNQANLKVLHWNAGIGSAGLDSGETHTVGTTTAGSVQATAVVNGGQQTSGSFPYTESAFTIEVSANANDSLQLTKVAATAPDTIAFSNKCSFPVQFLFKPDDAPAQTYMVPAGETFSLSTALQWQVTGTLRDTNLTKLANNHVDYPLAPISFNDPNATVTVVDTGNSTYVLQLS